MYWSRYRVWQGLDMSLGVISAVLKASPLLLVLSLSKSTATEGRRCTGIYALIPCHTEASRSYERALVSG
jgi:hypothetical protein